MSALVGEVESNVQFFVSPLFFGLEFCGWFVLFIAS